MWFRQNLHFNRLPDDLARIETELFVPQEITPWPTNGHQPRRAAVSSYGMSGTNVHAILEQAPETHAHAVDDAGCSPTRGTAAVPAVVHLGRRAAPHRRPAGRLGRERADDVALPDLAYTLARRRGHRPVRTAVIAGDRAGADRRLCARSPTATPRIRPRSARTTADRCGCSPARVRSGPRWAPSCWRPNRCSPRPSPSCEPLIARESGFSVTEAMTAPETVTGIDRVQPTLFTMQVALAATMKRLRGAPGRGHRALDG